MKGWHVAELAMGAIVAMVALGWAGSALGAPAAATPSTSPVSTGASSSAATLVWLEAGKPIVVKGGAAALSAGSSRDPAVTTPLGSLWKLFVYSYVVDQGLDAPAYRCVAKGPKDDVYCCEPGGSVQRDEALVRSCGPFFDPARLRIDAVRWRSFWQRQTGSAPEERGASSVLAAPPAWLTYLPSLQPQTEVPVTELLHALERVPPAARVAARQALLSNSTGDARVLGAIGSGPRFKTWSWRDGSGNRIGGAAGWLSDATPFWLGGRGTGKSVVSEQAEAMAQAWQPAQKLSAWPDAADEDAQPCVRVQMFARYPLRSVLNDRQVEASDGPLTGRHVLHFANGNRVSITGAPQLRVMRLNGQPRLEGRFALEDYVARVVDREGDAREAPAARALAVAARTWLMQNTAERGGCREVDDSSSAQRVSPNPPTAAARAAAAYTQGLLLRGTPVRYHQNIAKPGSMNWAEAVNQGRAGMGFTDILQSAYPNGVWDNLGAAECEAIPEAQSWLRERETRWRERLRREAGFEAIAARLQVCKLGMGHPNSDTRRMQVRIRDWDTREGRVSLVHEYVHLAFRNHSNGINEAFVERLAQQLADL